MQAGREIRVMVKPAEVDDDTAILLVARDRTRDRGQPRVPGPDQGHGDPGVARHRVRSLTPDRPPGDRAMPLADVHPFASHLPVRISFGDGAIGELRARARRGRRALGDACSWRRRWPRRRRSCEALAACEAAGIAITRHVKEPGRALADGDRRASRELVRSTGGEAVVGIGGGSALDLAKAARIVVRPGRLDRALRRAARRRSRSRPCRWC